MSNISQSCYLDVFSPKYDRYLFGFEKNFDYWAAFFWFANNWTICYYFIGIYLVTIFAGQQLMKSRPAFQLRGSLFLWNLFLALFSIVATIRMIPESLYMVNEYGFHGTVCEPGPMQHKQAGGIWAMLFTLSKILELGDTAFIVLRKTPLIFLHWYHHISVIFFTWGSSAYPSTIQCHFMVLNLVVHSFMYSYYALKVLRIRIPRWVSISITSLQLVQMMLGVFVTIYAYWAKSQNPDCCVFDQAITIAATIYVSYFVLFLNFFIKVYVSNKGALFDEKGSLKKMA